MVRFMTKYWIENREILLDGEFAALYPESSYPILIARGKNKVIAGVYDNCVLDLEQASFKNLDIINAKQTNYTAVKSGKNFDATIKIVNCMGEVVRSGKINIKKGVNQIDAPLSGIISLGRK